VVVIPGPRDAAIRNDEDLTSEVAEFLARERAMFKEP